MHDSFQEFNGVYGSHQTPCNVLTYETRQGVWYCVEGSTMANLTQEAITHGVDVETLPDDDCFTWGEPINTLDELEKAVEA